jgi:hypothetical protein
MNNISEKQAASCYRKKQKKKLRAREIESAALMMSVFCY